jgi:hypothetical protein
MSRSPSPILAIAAASILAGCQEPLRTAPARSLTALMSETVPPLVPRTISPRETDPDIDWTPTVNPQFNHHYVWLDAAQPPNGKLLVFLTGIGPTPRPRGQQLLQQEAARLGYHVIGLMYQNNVGPADVCASSPDPGCAENVRLEIVDGRAARRPGTARAAR